MKRGLVAVLLTWGLLVSVAALKAEVKMQEKSQFKMEGIMGRMLGMFGGSAAKEGVVSTIAVKGNRKVATTENTSEMIDLSEQKIYNLDLKKKTYEVITFEEMRRRVREAQEKAAKATKDQPSKKSEQPEKEIETDFALKESGQKRTINGFDCREVVMTMTTREKGKALEESGGMVMTSHIWLTSSIRATKELADFDQRYAKAMEQILGLGGSMEQMAMATAMYPGMKDMIGKMQVESVNMEGTPVLTEMTMEAVKSKTQMTQDQDQKQTQETESSGGLGSVRGLGGMLGRKLGGKKKTEGEAEKPADRVTIITMNNELLKVETSVPDSDMAIPAGFKEKK
jgi:hypothetical protein